jgi:hypothetical protein
MLYHGFQSDLSMLVTSLQFLSSKPLYKEDALLQGVASGIIDAQPLSKDEAWMLFRKIAFKDEQVPMDIEERARRLADECKGFNSLLKIKIYFNLQCNIFYYIFIYDFYFHFDFYKFMFHIFGNVNVIL